MGVAADLGYRHRRANPFQRTMQAFGATTIGAWFFAKTLTPLDRICHRLSGGRTSLPQLLAGLPVLFVTTRGAKTGQLRRSPLIAVPTGDTLALVGTNFGQASTPGWVFNLEADPRLAVTYRQREVDLVARRATESEQAEVWAAASEVYPGYRQYQARISGRQVRIFVLETASV